MGELIPEATCPYNRYWLSRLGFLTIADLRADFESPVLPDTDYLKLLAQGAIENAPTVPAHPELDQPIHTTSSPDRFHVEIDAVRDSIIILMIQHNLAYHAQAGVECLVPIPLEGHGSV